MFREKLKRDLDGISPDEELLSRVSLMMAEEAAKPKQPIYLNVAKWGGMAAAICLIAVGTVTFLGKDNDSHKIATANASGYPLEAAYSADMAAAEGNAESENITEETVNGNTDSSDTAVSSEAYTGTGRFANCGSDIDIHSIQFNKNPDLSGKTVPEGYANSEYTEPMDFFELVNMAGTIVIVKITDSGDYTGQSFTGNAEMDKALEEKWQSDPLTSEAKIYYAQAEAIVSGNWYTAGDIIPVFMPCGNFGATLEKDRYYLLILDDYAGGVCKLYNGAESVFEIMDDNTVISQSHFKVPSMFDGLTVDELAAVLKYEKEPKPQGLRK